MEKTIEQYLNRAVRSFLPLSIKTRSESSRGDSNIVPWRLVVRFGFRRAPHPLPYRHRFRTTMAAFLEVFVHLLLLSGRNHLVNEIDPLLRAKVLHCLLPRTCLRPCSPQPMQPTMPIL